MFCFSSIENIKTGYVDSLMLLFFFMPVRNVSESGSKYYT